MSLLIRARRMNVLRFVLRIVPFLTAFAVSTALVIVVSKFRQPTSGIVVQVEDRSFGTKKSDEHEAAIKAAPTSYYCGSYIPDQFGDNLRNGDGEIEYTTDDSLSYKGYSVTKRTRKFNAAAGIKGVSPFYLSDEYAVLTRNGEDIATFDGNPGDNSEISFGLFSFLGGETKQLIVEQTSNKFWRYWIVNLSPKYEVIYDSGKYDLVYSLETVDVDHDGVYEIVQNVGTFWYFDWFGNADSPRPEMILKYEPGLHHYVIANQNYKSIVLGDIGRRIEAERETKQSTGESCYKVVIDVTLRYIYAGDRDEGWAFFDREYNLTGERFEKESVRNKIMKLLRRDAVYKAIYGRRRRGNSS